MNETKFTKGNWVAKTDDGNIRYAVVCLSDKGGFDISDTPNCIANAHLIAAAPEMYGLLNQIAEMNLLSPHKSEIIERLLAKARGEI